MRCLLALPAANVVASVAAAMLLPETACAQQVVLNNTSNLDFGRFVAGTGGTVAIGPAGQRTKSGGVILLTSPTAGQAVFTASRNGGGSGNKAIVITLPSDGGVRLSSGAASMAVNLFNASPASLLAIPAGGTTLSVGATLIVGASQARGSYSGSFPLTVNYQ